jgi:hypothetical protein
LRAEAEVCGAASTEGSAGIRPLDVGDGPVSELGGGVKVVGVVSGRGDPEPAGRELGEAESGGASGSARSCGAIESGASAEPGDVGGRGAEAGGAAGPGEGSCGASSALAKLIDKVVATVTVRGLELRASRVIRTLEGMPFWNETRSVVEASELKRQIRRRQAETTHGALRAPTARCAKRRAARLQCMVANNSGQRCRN